MKEHIDDYYFDATYIILEQHYRTWDPHLCHWSKFDIILDACVYGPHDDLLTWMYKNFHDPLMSSIGEFNMWKLNPGVRTITLTTITNYTCKLLTKETE